MRSPIILALPLCAATLAGCTTPAIPEVRSPVSAAQRDDASAAITALQRGEFRRAEELSRARIEVDSSNPYPRLVHAIAAYERSMHQLALDARTMVVGGVESGNLNQKYLRATFTDGEAELAAIDRDLAVAEKSTGVGLELCVACWELDWNGNGRIDERDRLLFQIEEDADGKGIPSDDPRRKPTFRFDDGDVAWARAFVSFQRAALDVVLAYDLSDLVKLAESRRGMPDRIVLKLVDRGRIAQAKERVLEGLAQSDASRRMYLEETDDDREWVPNPRQKSHPMPMPVDGALYETWAGVVGDVRRIVEGEEGLALADLLELSGERTKHAPRGYLDVGTLFANPKDIVIDVNEFERADRKDDIDGRLRALLGEGWSSGMKPSPLPKRLGRMKAEIDHGEDSMRKKLRYLFWIN